MVQCTEDFEMRPAVPLNINLGCNKFHFFNQSSVLTIFYHISVEYSRSVWLVVSSLKFPGFVVF